MRWRDNADYEADHVFTVEQRNAVQPIEIARYLKFKAYGNADASSSDLPTVGRASSLEHYKKSISKFMTTTYPYNDQAKVGNPTQSTVVNQVVKDVKLMQCRKLGKVCFIYLLFLFCFFIRRLTYLPSFFHSPFIITAVSSSVGIYRSRVRTDCFDARVYTR